ncbi:TPA: PD-(D/E)XK nuclease-like domain-containing protein [Vibrio harveyi]|nr:PD-(D/E)XK nuclease-like domain-containing protein [Vibrio harveyi]
MAKYFEFIYPSKKTAHPEGEINVTVYAEGKTKKAANEEADEILKTLQGENAQHFKKAKVEEIDATKYFVNRAKVNTPALDDSQDIPSFDDEQEEAVEQSAAEKICVLLGLDSEDAQEVEERIEKLEAEYIEHEYDFEVPKNKGELSAFYVYMAETCQIEAADMLNDRRARRCVTENYAKARINNEPHNTNEEAAEGEPTQTTEPAEAQDEIDVFSEEDLKINCAAVLLYGANDDYDESEIEEIKNYANDPESNGSEQELSTFNLLIEKATDYFPQIRHFPASSFLNVIAWIDHVMLLPDSNDEKIFDAVKNYCTANDLQIVPPTDFVELKKAHKKEGDAKNVAAVTEDELDELSEQYTDATREELESVISAIRARLDARKTVTTKDEFFVVLSLVLPHVNDQVDIPLLCKTIRTLRHTHSLFMGVNACQVVMSCFKVKDVAAGVRGELEQAFDDAIAPQNNNVDDLETKGDNELENQDGDDAESEQLENQENTENDSREDGETETRPSNSEPDTILNSDDGEHPSDCRGCPDCKGITYDEATNEAVKECLDLDIPDFDDLPQTFEEKLKELTETARSETAKRVSEVNAQIDALPVGGSLIIEGLPNEVYHRAKGYSKSKLDLIARSPALVEWDKNAPRDDEKEETANIGNAAHCALLEPDEYVNRHCIMPDLNLRTNAGKAEKQEFIERAKLTGKTILSYDENRKILLMRDSALAHPTARGLLSQGKAEVSIFWRDPVTGFVFKIRPDWITDVGGFPMLVDVKTVADVNDFELSCGNYRYDVQDAFYSWVYEQATGQKPIFCFIAISKTIEMGRYPVRTPILDDDDKRKGFEAFTGNIMTLQECVKTNTFGGFETIKARRNYKSKY